MNRNKHLSITNIGMVSLMMVFMILCLILLAALSLSESTQDYRLSKKLADHTKDYYQASNIAEEDLAQIDAILHKTAESSETNTFGDAEKLQISNCLTELDIDGLTMEGDVISYQIPMNDSQSLSVRLNICEPDTAGASGSSGHYYRITCWKEISTQDWEGDNSVQLLQ